MSNLINQLSKKLLPLSSLQIAWQVDRRPKEILDEIKAKEMSCKDRAFLENQLQLTKVIYFKRKKEESINKYEKSLNFGLSFIFNIFASGLLGYYLGIYFFCLTYDQIISIDFFLLDCNIDSRNWIIYIYSKSNERRQDQKNQLDIEQQIKKDISIQTKKE